MGAVSVLFSGTIVPNLGTAALYFVLAVLAAQLLYTIWENRQ